MKKKTKKIAIAALDIGTSRIKLGVYCPQLSRQLIMLGNHENELFFGTGGEVRSDFSPVREKSFDLFSLLGNFLKENDITDLYIGICSHVSSLLEWDRQENQPVNNLFSIWLDSTCLEYLNEFTKLTENGKSEDAIGSFLPPGTNWLLCKLLEQKAKGFGKKSVFLQAGDAVFAGLTETYVSHFSSQVSMVHQSGVGYAGSFLDYLGLGNEQLPYISNKQPFRMLPEQRRRFKFPEESYVFPSLADFYASFIGLRLQNKEAFILGNTSEVAGMFSLEKPPFSGCCVDAVLNGGYIRYGSTSTGGNIINWFFGNILQEPATPAAISILTRQAEAVKPDECPFFLPYLEGERAPFWDNKLTASFIGLRSFHTRAHLFRSLLESVSFARRQLLESIGAEDCTGIKMGGGSSQNSLWNIIRASVTNKPFFISEEKELSILGVIDHIVETSATVSRYGKPESHFREVLPNAGLVGSYRKKYHEFLKYQKLINSHNE